MAPTLGLVILAVAAGYLVGLGGTALVRPARAYSFLSAFAQTSRANLAEAICRSTAGVGANLAAPVLPQPILWTVGGSFLVVTAAAMLLFPAAHRHIAARSVPAIHRFMPLVGVASLMLGLGLSSVLFAALDS